MTDHQREKLEELIQRQIEADRDSDPFAFFRGALIAIGVGVLVCLAVTSVILAYFGH